MHELMYRFPAEFQIHEGYGAHLFRWICKFVIESSYRPLVYCIFNAAMR